MTTCGGGSARPLRVVSRRSLPCVLLLLACCCCCWGAALGQQQQQQGEVRQPLATIAGCGGGAGAGAGAPQDAVLLRVSPWAGCGVQVTFGLGWGEVLPVTDENNDNDTAAPNNATRKPPPAPLDIGVGVVSSFAPAPGRAVSVSRVAAAARRAPSAAVERAPQTDGMTVGPYHTSPLFGCTLHL